MKWPQVKLDDICKVVGGTTPSTSVHKYWDGDITWLSPVDLPEVGSITYVNDSKRKITKLAVDETGLQILQPGSLVFSSRASIGKIGIVTKELTTNQGFTNFIPSHKVDVRYLAYALKAGIPAIEQVANSTTFKEVSRTALKNFKIPLPPLHIQQHIADTLDKADALRRKDQELLKKYDALAQSIFYDMFGDPVRNEKEWDSGPVIDYCSCIVPGRDKPKSFSGDIPWVTTEDLFHLNVTIGSKKKIGLTREEISLARARIIPKNSVIMTCVGDLGVISIAGKEMVVNQQLHAFQSGPKLNPVFLMFCLSYQKDYMIKMASSTTVPYMNKTVCNNIPIICPPINLQNHFADTLQKINALKHSDNQFYSNMLFNAVMHQYFS